MTGYELADLIAYILVPIIGGLVAWVLKLNNKVVAQCVEVTNIKDTNEKTAEAMTAIKKDLDGINEKMAIILAHLEIQEMPITKRDIKK